MMRALPFRQIQELARVGVCEDQRERPDWARPRPCKQEARLWPDASCSASCGRAPSPDKAPPVQCSVP